MSDCNRKAKSGITTITTISTIQKRRQSIHPFFSFSPAAVTATVYEWASIK